MSEQSPPALDEIVREFNRAREELGKVAGTLREFETIAEERRAERAALEGSATTLGDTASRLHTLTETLESAVSSVAEVLGAADSALRATDAGQLVERLTELDRSMQREGAQREEQLSEFRSQVQTRFEVAETLLQEVKSLAETTNQQVQTIAAKQEEFRQLNEENASLRAQLNKVRDGLKPRQLTALGLSE